MNILPPSIPKRSARAEHIISVAREMTEESGWEALTMRGLADRVGIKAPSLYKHTANKDELRAMLTINALQNVGFALWATEHEDGTFRLQDLVMTFRNSAVSHPELYRLVMTGAVSCNTLQEEPWHSLLAETSRWLNMPLASIAPNRDIAYSAWASAYGLVTLEVNGSLPGKVTSEKVWQTLIDIYAPHFDAARDIRREGYVGEVDTFDKPIVVEPVPLPTSDDIDPVTSYFVNGHPVPGYVMPVV